MNIQRLIVDLSPEESAKACIDISTNLPEWFLFGSFAIL